MSDVPMNDLRRTQDRHRAEIEAAVRGVLESGRYLAGARTGAFAEAFATSLGIGHCLPVANGTDALELALRAVAQDAAERGREGRIEVIGVANAGGYSTTACLQVGLTPVLVDIDEESQLIAIEAAVGALSPRTLAVVATHLYGGLVDVPALRAAIDAAGYGDVAIVEDCAQAHGLSGTPGRAGAMGDLATFSFYPTKNLGAFGDAGAIVTRSAALFDRLKRLHQYGWEPGAKYRIGLAGARNSRMDELQGAILAALLPHLDDWNERRRAIVERYERAAPGDIRFVRSPIGHVAHLAVALCERRDALRDHLARHGVATEIHYPTLDCDQPGWPHLAQAHDTLPVSRKSVARLLTLPCFPTMTDNEIDQVCRALGAWSTS